MALIVCPECKKRISQYAEKCPECGFPIGEKAPKTPEGQQENSAAIEAQRAINHENVRTAEEFKKVIADSEKPRTTKLAIFALIFSILPHFCLLGVIMGIVDLTRKDVPRKTGIATAAVVVGILMILGTFVIPKMTGTDKKETNTSTSSYQSREAENKAETPAVVERPREEYTSYTVAQLMNDLDQNALSASDKYKDQYIEITGVLNNIDASGKYISLRRADNEFSFIGVQCYVQNDTQSAQILNMSDGDVVTLRGKCTDVGEVLGYSLYIDSIDGYEAAAPVEQNTGETINCSAQDLVNALQDNAMKAKNTYEGRNIVVSGTLGTIDASGAYITITAGRHDYSFVNIQCFIKDDATRKKVAALSKDANITITGKCTSVGEFLGYSIDIDNIN